MLINYFLRLAIIDRVEFVKENGVFLMRRTEGEFIYNLYELFGYYVEIKFNPKEKKTELVKLFNDTDKLSDYLNDIDLP
jgi:hypothetical protein